MIENVCQKCGNDEGDLRKLWMSCLYEMNEVGIPFGRSKDDHHDFYTISVCKQCRGDWMMAIKNWFEEPIVENKCDSGIFIPEYGKLLQVTPEEYEMNRIRKDSDSK